MTKSEQAKAHTEAWLKAIRGPVPAGDNAIRTRDGGFICQPAPKK